MDPLVDQQRLRDYQSRITKWIGRQGIFFQIRYLSLTSGGSFRVAVIRLMTTLGVICVLGAGLTFGGLKIYQRTEMFGEKLEAHLSRVLGVEAFQSKGFSREAGNGVYRRLNLTGGENSFFYEGTIVGLKGEMPFLAGVVGDWTPAAVTIEKADFFLKAGGRQSEMEAAFSGIVESLKGSALNRVKISDLSCEWGYSKLTFGGVYNTTFEASLKDGRWNILLHGGYLRQNWIGPLKIKQGVLSLGKDGIEVGSLVLQSGDGLMDLEGMVHGPLNMPEFDLTGKFTGFPVAEMFEIDLVQENRFIEGTVSGDLVITGSTNRRIETRGKVALREEDEIRVRDQWELLRAVSAVFGDGNYLSIGFGSGSFDFVTSKGGCEVSNIDLREEKVARLTGSFSSRLPSQEEAAEYLGIKLTEGFSKNLTDTSSAQKLEDDRLSIKRVSKDADGEFQIELDLGGENDSVTNLQASLQEMDGMKLKREMSRSRLTGKMKLALPLPVVSENKKVASIYTSDEEGWSWIPIEFKEEKFTKLTFEASEKLLREGKESRASGTGPKEED